MTPIERSVAKVRRRVAVSHALHALGWAVLAGLLLAAMVMAADKLMPMSYVPSWVYGVIAGLGVVLTLVLAFRNLPGEAEAAVLLDEKLGLKDSLGTALYTAGLKEQNELTAQVAREADDAAQRARVMANQAAPIGLSRVWNWTPIGLAALLGVIFIMPENAADPLGQVAAAEEEAEQQAIKDAVEEVIINTIDPNLAERDEEDDTEQIAEGLPEDLKDQLVSISDEMRKNPSPERVDELRKQLESVVSDAEDRLGEQADIVEATYNPLRSDASQLNAGTTGPADQFTQAMNRGDFESAKDAVEKMQEQIEQGDFTQEEKQQLQQQLNNLSQQLQQQANQAQQRQQQTQQQAQQNLQQQLQQQGMSPQQAQQTAQQR